MKSPEKPSLSFEVFPPKTLEGFRKLDEACIKLNELRPDFFSVTYGAAGSYQEKTWMTVQRLIKNRLSIVPHISCVGMTLPRLMDLLEKYKSLGINRLVVVRGDPSSEQPLAQDFQYAVELVKSIRNITGSYYHITVAAYPEFHPQAANSDVDLQYFQQKVESGANTAITQFFFNTDAYFRFKECCYKMGLRIPIIPGILPIYDYSKLLNFSTACGAEIPLWLRKRLERFIDDPISLEELGIEIVTKFCETLTSGGAEALHFYTLNQANVVLKICRNLNRSPH